MRASELITQILAYAETSCAPKPFAQRYPTRIYWSITYARGREIKYSGKPNVVAVRRWLKLHNTTTWVSAYFTEVDAVNQLSSYWSEWRTRERTAPRFFDGWRIYHPYSPQVSCWNWILEPWWLKRIKVASGIQIVYSQLEKLETATHLIPYKTWYATLRFVPRRNRAAKFN